MPRQAASRPTARQCVPALPRRAFPHSTKTATAKHCRSGLCAGAGWKFCALLFCCGGLPSSISSTASASRAAAWVTRGARGGACKMSVVKSPTSTRLPKQRLPMAGPPQLPMPDALATRSPASRAPSTSRRLSSAPSKASTHMGQRGRRWGRLSAVRRRRRASRSRSGSSSRSRSARASTLGCPTWRGQYCWRLRLEASTTSSSSSSSLPTPLRTSMRAALDPKPPAPATPIRTWRRHCNCSWLR